MSMSITERDVIARPWLGLGIGWDAETKDRGPIPLTEQQWQLLLSRVDYMRPSWMRSMLNVGWFCPGGIVGNYAFTSAEMLAWYPILDYAQAHALPVMIGTWDTNPWSFYSEGYATALADLLQYLIEQRGYTTIRYLCCLNEPDSKLPDFETWRNGARYIYSILAQRGLTDRVLLVGPDTSWTNGWITESDLPWNESSFLGAYEWHHYERTASHLQDGQVERYFQPIVERLADSAQAGSKPILLGEMGWGYESGPGDNQYHVKDYQYGVEMADFALQIARAGISGGAAWDLDDAMHNKVWGMWNIVEEPEARPWFYFWSLLSRYFPARAVLYRPASPDAQLRVLAAQTGQAQDRSEPGWSVVMVNRGTSPVDIELALPDSAGSKEFRGTTYSEQAFPGNLETRLLPIPQTLTRSGLVVKAQVPANGLLLVTNLA